MNLPPTRFADMRREQAFLILSVVLLLIMYGLTSLTQAFPPRERKDTDGGDARLYRSIIERIQGGENYYTVAGEELRSREYATRPFFNWRLPSIAWTIGHLPSPEWGKWMLTVLAFLTLFLWMPTLDHEGGFSYAVVGGVMLCGPVLLCLSNDGFLYHELWAGVLIALSLAAHARGFVVVSAMTGILAVCIRELALPYVCLMLVFAWKERQEREAYLWLGGLTVFSLYLTYHASIVSGLLRSIDQSNKSWVQFGGWPFVLSTGEWNAFLFASPNWVVAVVLPMALLGLAGWRGAVGSRVALTLFAYYGAYLIGGRMDNSYWGMIYTMLIPLGLLFAVPSVVDLLRVIFAKKSLAS